VSFAAITLCVASQRVFIFVSVYFVTDSVRKILDTPSYDWSDVRNNACCVRMFSPCVNESRKSSSLMCRNHLILK
jgi:hypothetical protein